MTEPRTGDAVDRFFSTPNEIDPHRLPDGLGAFLGALTSRTRNPEKPRSVLPARIAGETRWYGIAANHADGRVLREELRARLGAPFSSGVTAVPQSSVDELDQRALEVSGPAGVALVVRVGAAHVRSAREAVRALVDLWDSAPRRERVAPRPVGRVLRDFYEGVLVRDRQAAEDALGELRTRGLVAPTNARFLLVELLGALGSPEELAEDPRLKDISLLRRPPRVTNTLARAADTLFVPTEGMLDQDALRRTALRLDDCWPGLVVHAADVRSVEAARCLALVEMQTEARPSIVAYLSEHWSDDRVVGAVLRTMVPRRTSEDRGNPYVLLACGELEAAVEVCERLPPAIETVAAAIHAAHELGTIEYAARAASLFEHLSPSEQAQLRSRPAVASRLEHLRGIGSEAVTAGDWLGWLRNPDSRTSGRPDLLAEWSSNVRLDAGVLTPAYVDALLSELIDALNDDRRASVRDALPILISSLLRTGRLRPEAVQLCIEIVDVVLSSGVGAVERALALELADAVLDCGCSVAEYKSLLGTLGAHFEDIGPRSIGFVSDAVSLVLDANTSDHEARQALLSLALAAVTRSLGRLDPAEVEVLRHVFTAAGVAMPPAASEERADLAVRQVDVVGIYSLEESTARRAATWIAGSSVRTDVRLSHDYVSSDRLVSLVRGSDVMLVQTSKATHAATNAIEAAARGHTPIVYVAGRGASALLRAFIGWASAA